MKAPVIKTVNMTDRVNDMLVDIVEARNRTGYVTTSKKEVVAELIVKTHKREVGK